MQISADISIKRHQNMQMHAYIFKKTNSAKAFQVHSGRKTTEFFYYCRPVKKSHADYANTMHRVFSHTEATEITEAHMLLKVYRTAIV